MKEDGELVQIKGRQERERSNVSPFCAADRKLSVEEEIRGGDKQERVQRESRRKSRCKCEEQVTKVISIPQERV